MAIRNLLHLNKVEEFKKWMENKNGYISVDVKGDYEILRMIKPKESPVIIFKGGSNNHSSFEDKHFKLVVKFIKESKLNLWKNNANVKHAPTKIKQQSIVVN